MSSYGSGPDEPEVGLPDLLLDKSIPAEETNTACVAELTAAGLGDNAATICADYKLHVPFQKASQFAELMARATINTYSVSSPSLFAVYSPDVFYSIWDFGQDELPVA